MKSYSNGKDIFGNKGPSTEDHIWPLSKDGSSSNENIQLLTSTSNNEKGDRTKGVINGIRFSVYEVGRSSSGKKIGQMQVKIDGKWIDVK